MRMIKTLSLSACLVFVLSSCSTVNKIAVSSSSGLVYKASDNVLRESNPDILEKGLAGNLILIEGLLAQSPTNENLLATLTKGYAGYAFLINETQMLEEEWAELKSDKGKHLALLNYTRSMDFGFRYLKNNGIEFNDLLSRMNEAQGIVRYLNKKLGDNQRDMETVLFTAQSLAGIINLQKDNIIMVSQLPIAKAMFDWVCLKDPNINYGMCDIFNGAYEAGRPVMLGGNPEKGREIFEKGIAKHPHNWLMRVSYMQYYLIPQEKADEFKKQMSQLEISNEEYNKYYIFSHERNLNAPWSREEGLRLYQAFALKRYQLMEKYRKQFF